jgi:hypothetical protein
MLGQAKQKKGFCCRESTLLLHSAFDDLLFDGGVLQ